METAKPVMGVTAPPPRPTRKAIWLAVRYLGLPLIGVLIALDLVVWAVAQAVWGACVGVWCWF